MPLKYHVNGFGRQHEPKSPPNGGGLGITCPPPRGALDAVGASWAPNPPRSNVWGPKSLQDRISSDFRCHFS
eukprot:11104083-Karenia_brevis.AAC.1